MTTPCRTRSLRSRAWMAAAFVALGLLTACSGTARGQVSRTLPQVTATPVLLDSTDLRLPLEPYLLSTQELADLTTAREVLAGRCAARFGVTMPAPPPRHRQVGPHTRTERRYGLADPALAADDGYHLGDRDPRNLGKMPETNMSATQELVLIGMPEHRRVRGQTVPAGGCFGEADRKIGGSPDNPDVVGAIDTRSVVRATKDPRVVATFHAWSACMKAKGHHYAAPWDAGNDPRFTGPHSSLSEIAVATADVACKKKTNVVGVWYAADVAYQKALIEQNQAALDKARKDNAAHLLAAADILASR